VLFFPRRQFLCWLCD